MKNVVLLLLLSVQVFSQSLKRGVWRGVLLLRPEESIELPFNFDVKQKGKSWVIEIRNADERIVVDEVTLKKDSVIFKMPVFDSEFRTKNYGDSLVGVWINHARTSQNVIAFKAWAGNSNRFNFPPGKPYSMYEGKWDVTFSPGSADSTKAIGVFKQGGSIYATGTFLTETGDYRYLQGMQHKGKLYLSCFDGSHAFLFTAKADNTLEKIADGDFYSGAHWHEKWTAVRNDSAKLRSADSITFLKKGYGAVSFSFKNSESKLVSLSDKQYKNKVVIVQIMGSWCPNCMDETKYLSELYKKYKKDGLEIIGLAYERTNDFQKAATNVNRLKKRFDVEYEILITGVTGKEKASENFPMLNNISAFPTTLYIDKSGNVRKIYTGFSGPATGEEFDKLKKETENLIESLLKEK